MRGSNRDAFDLVEGEIVISPVVELGRLRRFVVSHLLGLFQRAAVQQVVRDPGGPETVTANRGNTLSGNFMRPLRYIEDCRRS